MYSIIYNRVKRWICFSALLGLSNVALAATATSLKFADQVSLAQLEAFLGKTYQERFQHYGEGLTGRVSALMLPINDSIIAFYRVGGTFEANLSVFVQEEERVLWKIGISPSGLIPQPVLATGYLNANETPDILLTLANGNVGNSLEHYEQYMLFFLDGEKEARPSIPLSASDWAHGDYDAPVYYLVGSDGKPASERESLVMLVPASESIPCTIAVWSRIEIFEHPPTKTPESTVFQLETYHLHDTQLTLTENISGSRDDTIKLLRAIIQQTRSQGAEPIFLNFDKKQHLCSEHDWFNWLGEGE